MIRTLIALLFAALALPASSTILRKGGSGSTPPVNCSSGTSAQIAACLTAQNNPNCTSIGDYYYEIVSATATLFSYQQGNSIKRETLAQMDSGTKFVDGAYWAQVRAGVMTSADVLNLSQRSAYLNMPSNCPSADSVFQCITETSTVNCTGATSYVLNSVTIAATDYGALCSPNVGLNAYNGANFQVHGAQQAGFSALNRTQLAETVNTELNYPTITATVSNGGTVWTSTGSNLASGTHLTILSGAPSNMNNWPTGNVPSQNIYIYYAVQTTTNTFKLCTNADWKANATACTPIPAGNATTATIRPDGFIYSFVLLAGGANQSAAGTIILLQNILSNALYYHDVAGTYETCTNYPGNGEPPGGTAGNYIGQTIYGPLTFGSATGPSTIGSGTTVSNNFGGVGAPNGPWISAGLCQTNVNGTGSSPIPANYLYSISCWDESDPFGVHDRVCAGIGAKGFVLWISADRTKAGVFVRVNNPGQGYTSDLCAALIRNAYNTSTQQTGKYPSP